MKILVVSDTHGYDTNLKKALKETGTPDYMIHLGDSECEPEHMEELADCPVIMVAGNCDYFTKLPRTRVIELDGCRMLLTHGHYYHVSAGTWALAEAARTNGCSVAMFGHTHRPFIDQSNPELTVLNPGSLSFPRQEGRRPSYILMETGSGKTVTFSLHFLQER